MRGYLVIEDVIKNDYFNTCFDSYWKENEDISDERIINQILQKCKIENNKFFKDIKDTNIKDELKRLTRTAFERDIFGAPTFVVNTKIFWVKID